MQVLGVEIGELGQLTQELAFKGAVGQCAPQRASLSGHASAPFGGAQVAIGTGGIQQKLLSGLGVFHALGKSLGAMGTDEAVGIVFGR